MNTVSHPATLRVLPGQLLVIFIVTLQQAGSVLALPPSRFLEGLKAACALLSFQELLRDDERLDELLPWAGNV
ncbi:MAG: hypothetical protein ACOVOT_04960 [Rubrivivax sp.]|nr:hypothetical protein [Rubrivivax sp.]